MSYAVNWTGKIIVIPVSDLTLVSGNHYTLSMTLFWLEVRRLEADPNEGLWAPHILEHNNTRTLAGTTYVPENVVVNGYAVQFSAPATRVDLVDDNNNVVDVMVVNGISVVPSNSAGNSVTVVGSGVTSQDIIDISDQSAIKTWNALTASFTTTGTFGKIVGKLLTVGKFLGLK